LQENIYTQYSLFTEKRVSLNLLIAVKYTTWKCQFHNEHGAINCRRQVFAFLTANVQPGPKSDQLLDLEGTAATCLPTKQSRLGSSEFLKGVLTSCLEQIGQHLIDKEIDQWLIIRISQVMRAKGGHI